jgi:nuclear polyadenylated RNA-binding protein NAB2
VKEKSTVTLTPNHTTSHSPPTYRTRQSLARIQPSAELSRRNHDTTFHRVAKSAPLPDTRHSFLPSLHTAIMADITVDAGSSLAASIQRAAQAKLMENGWAPEETDTTLSEYVTMMLVNGKDMAGVQSELGGELLGVGEDDPDVAAFSRWLFDEARNLSGQGASTLQQQQPTAEGMSANGNGEASAMQVEMMGDVGPGEAVPSGPKAMRNGSDGGRGRGRGGRMLGQLNRSMDRSSDDPLRRIKGAASGAGRIDSHSGRPPRGPRGGGVANGVQRMMNGGARGGAMGGAAAGGNAMMNVPQDQQMMFVQMMEMQAQMMAQMMQNGQAPNFGAPQSGGGRGGRGGRGGKSMFDRMDKKARHSTPGTQDDAASSNGGMDIDRPLEPEKKAPFDTMCKFNLRCLNADCPFAHQSPANTRPHLHVDMSDTCAYGPACTNNKCMGKHPSPAQRQAYSASSKSEVECKFYPNCSAGAQCPFKHPETRPCRNGADCKVEGCPFAHSTIACRYNPCTRRDCPYKHAEGQKRGTFSDKVWTSEGDGSAGIQEAMNGGGSTNGTSERFAGLAQTGDVAEELILPGQNGGASMTAPAAEVGMGEVGQDVVA